MATSLTSITSNTGRDKLIALLEQTLASTARLSMDPADWQPKTDAWEHPLVPASGASDGSISHSPGKVGVFNTNGRPYYNLSEGEGMITFMLPSRTRASSAGTAPAMSAIAAPSAPP